TDLVGNTDWRGGRITIRRLHRGQIKRQPRGTGDHFKPPRRCRRRAANLEPARRESHTLAVRAGQGRPRANSGRGGSGLPRHPGTNSPNRSESHQETSTPLAGARAQELHRRPDVSVTPRVRTLLRRFAELVLLPPIEP